MNSQASVIIIELQSKWLAKVLSGKLELPSEEEMMNCAKKYYSKGYSSILGPFEVCKNFDVIEFCIFVINFLIIIKMINIFFNLISTS